MNIKISFLILVFFGIMVSCKPSFKMQSFSINRQIQKCDSCKNRQVWTPKKTIVLVSDSILNYTTIYGGLGTSTKVKYKIVSDTLLLESKDVYDKDMSTTFTNFSTIYKYTSDSLISLQNDEKYFSEGHIKRIPKKKIETFFIILNEKKYEINNIRSAKKISSKLKNINYELIELDVNEAKSKFGIDKEFKTFQVVDKNILN